MELRIESLEKELSELKAEIQKLKVCEEKEEENEEKDITNLIKQTLFKAGINSRLTGYKYLVEEIKAKITQKNYKPYMVSVSMFSEHSSNIEHAIRTVKKNVFKSSIKTKLFNSLFQEYEKIPVNKEFIIVFADYLENMLYKESEYERLKGVTKKILANIGIQRNLVGYNYLVEEILAIIEQPDYHLYQTSMEKFSDSYSNIGFCLERAKTSAFTKNISPLSRKLFGENVPTNIEFLITVSDYIKSNL